MLLAVAIILSEAKFVDQKSRSWTQVVKGKRQNLEHCNLRGTKPNNPFTVRQCAELCVGTCQGITTFPKHGTCYTCSSTTIVDGPHPRDIWLLEEESDLLRQTSEPKILPGPTILNLAGEEIMRLAPGITVRDANAFLKQNHQLELVLDTSAEEMLDMPCPDNSTAVFYKDTPLTSKFMGLWWAVRNRGTRAERVQLLDITKPWKFQLPLASTVHENAKVNFYFENTDLHDYLWRRVTFEIESDEEGGKVWLLKDHRDWGEQTSRSERFTIYLNVLAGRDRYTPQEKTRAAAVVVNALGARATQFTEIYDAAVETSPEFSEDELLFDYL